MWLGRRPAQMLFGDLSFILGYLLLTVIIVTAGWWRWEALALRRAHPLVVLLPFLVAGLDVIEDIILFFILRTDAQPPAFIDGSTYLSHALFFVAWTKWIAIVALAMSVALALAVWVERRAEPFPDRIPPKAPKEPSKQEATAVAIEDDARYQAYDHPPDGSDYELNELGANPQASVGICLSGGGIRSTAFSLGVLAELEEPLEKDAIPPYKASPSVTSQARYLTAVSGGYWAATAWTLQKALDREREPRGTANAALTVFTGLRKGCGITGFQRQKYLLNGRGSIAGGVAWAVLCSLTNIVLVGLIVYVVAWPLGMLMGTVAIRPDLRAGQAALGNLGVWPWVLPSIVFGLAAAIAFLLIGTLSKAIAQHWTIGAALLGLAVFSLVYLLWLPSFFAYLADGNGLADAIKRGGEIVGTNRCCLVTCG